MNVEFVGIKLQASIMEYMLVKVVRDFLGEQFDLNSPMINVIVPAKFRKKIVTSANTVVFKSAFQLECHIMQSVLDECQGLRRQS